MKKMSEYIELLEKSIISSKDIEPEIFHNTELLLKLYRKVLLRVKRRLEYDEVETYEGENKNIYGLASVLAGLDTEYGMSRFEERMLSIEVSTSILSLMEKTLLLVREYEEKGEVQYKILYYYYFEKNHNTNEEIMEMLGLPCTTYYRYKKTAVQSFAVNLWGYIIPELINNGSKKKV